MALSLFRLLCGNYNSDKKGLRTRIIVRSESFGVFANIVVMRLVWHVCKQCYGKNQFEPEEVRDGASRGNIGSCQLPIWATFKTRFLRLKSEREDCVLPD